MAEIDLASRAALTDTVSECMRWQTAVIENALRLVCAHFGIDPLVDTSRIERVAIRSTTSLDSQEIRVDGRRVWGLSWEFEGLTLQGSASWFGPMALSHAFVSPMGVGFAAKERS